VKSYDELVETLTAYVLRAAEKMRRQGLATSSSIVPINTNKHNPDQPQYYADRSVKLTIATADTGRLVWAALWSLKGIYPPGFCYKKTGVLFLDLAPAAAVQGSLFIQPDTTHRVRLIELMDDLKCR